MKLGSSCICPLTGVRGYVVRFIGDVPIARAADGTKFRVKRLGGEKRGPKKQVWGAGARRW